MDRLTKVFLLYCLTLGCGSLIAQSKAAPSIHPKKQVYRDMLQWPAVSPGEVGLKNFHPFRAVYERHYKQGAGPKAGEPRQDRVIITAEEAGWDGRRAAIINLFDTGGPKYDDTNGRNLCMYMDLDHLQLLFEIGPIPGNGKDYYLLRAMEDKIMGTMVITSEGKSDVRTVETGQPGFGGPGPWVMASMSLSEGMKIRLDPAYSPGTHVLGSKSPGRVIGRETFKARNGKKYKAWVVESAGSLKSPRVLHSYLVDRPPYLIAKKRVNLDTGEEQVYFNLMEFQEFGK